MQHHLPLHGEEVNGCWAVRSTELGATSCLPVVNLNGKDSQQYLCTFAHQYLWQVPDVDLGHREEVVLNLLIYVQLMWCWHDSYSAKERVIILANMTIVKITADLG